jgi:hypothetical protein
MPINLELTGFSALDVRTYVRAPDPGEKGFAQLGFGTDSGDRVWLEFPDGKSAPLVTDLAEAINAVLVKHDVGRA